MAHLILLIGQQDRLPEGVPAEFAVEAGVRLTQLIRRDSSLDVITHCFADAITVEMAWPRRNLTLVQGE